MDKTCMNYILAEPYPAVSPQKPDNNAARRLLGSYAGPQGELTAILQYVYNSQLAPLAGAPQVGELFHCVSMVEMRHLELIGKLVLAYGGDPGYLYYQTPGRTAWWTGANVSYVKQPARMLRDAIAGEEQAIAEYRRLTGSLQDSGAKALLQRIIADEEHHIALFTGALQKL